MERPGLPSQREPSAELVVGGSLEHQLTHHPNKAMNPWGSQAERPKRSLDPAVQPLRRGREISCLCWHNGAPCGVKNAVPNLQTGPRGATGPQVPGQRGDWSPGPSGATAWVAAFSAQGGLGGVSSREAPRTRLPRRASEPQSEEGWPPSAWSASGFPTSQWARTRPGLQPRASRPHLPLNPNWPPRVRTLGELPGPVQPTHPNTHVPGACWVRLQ